MNHVSSVISAKTGISRVQSLVRSDKAADDIDKKTAAIWRKIRALLSASPMNPDAQRQLTILLTDINRVAFDGIRDALRSEVRSSRLRTASDLVKAVPVEYLSLAVAGKRTDASARIILPSSISEGRRATPAEREQIEAMLLPAEDEQEVDRIVYQPVGGITWQQRMAGQTSLAPPPAVAAQVAMAMLQGESVDQLTARLEPVVQGVRNSARRIARTEMMRASNEATIDMYEALGPMVIGYQIHAILDWRVRPHHAARHGTIYYRNPKPGQPSMTNMPRPPIEEDGSIAYNCRCTLSAVFMPAKHIEDDPALKALFVAKDGDLIPDPRTYDRWFASASEQERRWAVGSRRLQAAARKLEPGETLQWSHVVNPSTGTLLPHQAISAEQPAVRAERIQQVNSVIAQRAELHRKVMVYGYLPPEPEQPMPKAIILKPKPPKPYRIGRKAPRLPASARKPSRLIAMIRAKIAARKRKREDDKRKRS